MNIESEIYKTAIDEGVPKRVAELIVQQGKVESGNFGSDLFRISRNIFGMKMPSKRKSPYIDGPSPVNPPKSEGQIAYAHYDSIEDAVKDLINWFKYQKVNFNKIQDEESYSAFLKSKNFFGPESEVYENLLLQYYHDTKNAIGKAINANQGITVATGITLVAMFGYFILKVAKLKKK